MLRISFLLLLISIVFQVEGQEEFVNVPIVFQNTDTFNLFDRTNWSMIIDDDRTLEGTFSERNIEIPVPDSLIQLTISGGVVQPFYNEYTVEALEELFEIRLYFKYVRGTKTPRFFVEAIKNPNIQVSDSLNWFVGWLDQSLEEDEILNGYSVHVYQSKELKDKERRLIKKLHSKIGEYLGGDPELIFTNEPYVTTDEDSFNLGTKITQEFIDAQNTEYMKGLAEQYSIVIMIVINWNLD